MKNKDESTRTTEESALVSSREDDNSVRVVVNKDEKGRINVKLFSGKTVLISGALTVNLIYSVIVSGMYAELASQRSDDPFWQSIYAASAFSLNLPMAFVFAVIFYEFLSKLKKGNHAFKLSVIPSLVLASLTTFAGISVAKDSIAKISWAQTPGAQWAGVGLFSFNTLSTRLVGGAGLIYAFLHWFSGFIYSHMAEWKPFYDLLYDLKLHGSKVNIKIDIQLYSNKTEAFNKFVELFYGKLIEQGIHPHRNNVERIKFLLGTSLTGALLYFSLYLFPLWLGLTEAGLKYTHQLISLFPEKWSHDPNLIWSSATASQLFYSYSAYEIPKLWSNVIIVLARKSSKMIREWYNADEERYRPISIKGRVAAVSTLLLVPITLAFFSGAGYSREMQAQQEQEAPFGETAQTTYLNHEIFYYFLYALLAPYLPTLAMFYSGNGANGFGALNFLSRWIPWFRETRYQESGDIGSFVNSLRHWFPWFGAVQGEEKGEFFDAFYAMECLQIILEQNGTRTNDLDLDREEIRQTIIQNRDNWKIQAHCTYGGWFCSGKGHAGYEKIIREANVPHAHGTAYYTTKEQMVPSIRSANFNEQEKDDEEAKQQWWQSCNIL